MKITAFDLSLTGTGWAIWSDGSITSGTLRPPKGMVGIPRLDWMSSSVVAHAHDGDIIVFEGASFRSKDPSVYWLLWPERTWYLVPPMTLKKFVAGERSAAEIKKEHMMLAIFQSFGITPKDNNEADAIGLLHIGMSIGGVWRGNAIQRGIADKIAAQHKGGI